MSLFRRQPPADLVIRMLATAGLKSLDDASWFMRESIKLADFEVLLVGLAPYYTPSKDNYTTRPITPFLAIIILRQVLKEHSRKLQSKSLQSIAWYSVCSDTTPDSSMTVSFS